MAPLDLSAELALNGLTTLGIGYIAWKAKNIRNEWEHRGELLDRLARVVLGRDDTGDGLVTVVENHEELHERRMDRIERVERRVDVLVEASDAEVRQLRSADD